MRVLLLCLLAATGCVDPDPPVLRTLVTVVATQDGRPAEEATARLVAEGRRSLVVVEAALHTADAPGRRRLVRVIRRLVAEGEKDGCPLLGHVATYDDDVTVRREADAARSGC
ncbi:MAG: hypothetical protein ABI321_22825 [Polyangia bacterium]